MTMDKVHIAHNNNLTLCESINKQYDMVVIGHHGIGANFDRKH
jgi:hypothetical protein